MSIALKANLFNTTVWTSCETVHCHKSVKCMEEICVFLCSEDDCTIKFPYFTLNLFNIAFGYTGSWATHEVAWSAMELSVKCISRLYYICVYLRLINAFKYNNTGK